MYYLIESRQRDTHRDIESKRVRERDREKQKHEERKREIYREKERGRESTKLTMEKKKRYSEIMKDADKIKSALAIVPLKYNMQILPSFHKALQSRTIGQCK